MDIGKIEYLCPNCMKLRRRKAPVCEWCGFDESGYQAPLECLRPGTILNGIYYVGRVIGNGGFANTYVAYNLSLERICAIKEFYIRNGGMVRNSGHSSNISYIHGDGNQQMMLRANFEKFEQEARILAQLGRIPGIVRIYSLFYENNTCYIEEEFLYGERLKDFVKQHGPISFSDLAEKISPMMKSIEVLHEKGIFHRDISPDNIMVCYPDPEQRSLESAEFVLIDFGAAKQQGTGDNSYVVYRKKGYTSLEQMSGAVEANAGMDVYSLAASMYFCLCGKDPSDAGARAAGIQDTLIPPAAQGVCLTERQEKVLLKAMSIHERDRYPSMKDFLDGIGWSMTWEEPAQHPSRSKLVVYAEALGGIVLILLSAYFIRMTHPFQTQTEPLSWEAEPEAPDQEPAVQDTTDDAAETMTVVSDEEAPNQEPAVQDTTGDAAETTTDVPDETGTEQKSTDDSCLSPAEIKPGTYGIVDPDDAEETQASHPDMQDVVVIDQPQDAAATDQPQDAAATDQPQDSSSTDQLRNAAVTDQLLAAPPDTNTASAQTNETNPAPELVVNTEPPYIIPGCNSRYLTVEEIRQYDPGTLRLARNEIYARKGRWFNAADLQAYFNSQSWYHGYIDPAAFDSQEATLLNSYEYSNARLLLSYEKGEIY